MLIIHVFFLFCYLNIERSIRRIDSTLVGQHVTHKDTPNLIVPKLPDPVDVAPQPKPIVAFNDDAGQSAFCILDNGMVALLKQCERKEYARFFWRDCDRVAKDKLRDGRYLVIGIRPGLMMEIDVMGHKIKFVPDDAQIPADLKAFWTYIETAEANNKKR